MLAYFNSTLAGERGTWYGAIRLLAEHGIALTRETPDDWWLALAVAWSNGSLRRKHVDKQFPTPDTFKVRADGENRDTEEELDNIFAEPSCTSNGGPKFTTGSLIHYAREGGYKGNIDNWPVADVLKDGDIITLNTVKSAANDTPDPIAELNNEFAVVKYKSKVVVAQIGDRVEFLEVEDFHRLFANKFVLISGATGKSKQVPVSKAWFTWDGRREYINPGVVFEPGNKDRAGALNLWRGFGVEPEPGDWSLLKAHIRKVICGGNEDFFHWLLCWMALGVQQLDRPLGVAVALRGGQGAGKGIFARTYGGLFGQHFLHISQGNQLTGRFNGGLGSACAVFLDEALWAGDRQGEGVLKALVTEPTLQIEAKFRDPIPVPNRLRLMIASNNDWLVPVGVGDRRFAVFDVANTYAGPNHADYWAALYAEIKNGGQAAMLHELLATPLDDYDVRRIPDTLARAEQKLHSLRGTDAWLAQIMQDGAIGDYEWQMGPLTVDKDAAYQHYQTFSKDQREFKPDTKVQWSKTLRKALGDNLLDHRPRAHNPSNKRHFTFSLLECCRGAFQNYIGASWKAMSWDDDDRKLPLRGGGTDLDQDEHLGS